jgi:hypothetical protein
VGQVKSVKTVLKQLQQSIQTITTPGILRSANTLRPLVVWFISFCALPMKSKTTLDASLTLPERKLSMED